MVPVTSDELYNSMRELIDNKTYTENVQKCAKILKSLPDAKQELVFWTNHVLEFGSSHLKPLSANMGAIEFYMLDVLAFLLTLFTVIIFILYFCCTRIIRYCSGKGSAKNKRD